MQELISKLKTKNSSKIILCVLDGVGGLPLDGVTELEAANTPNLDKILDKSSCGLHLPVARGITPGSGAAHLGLFGYDPLKYEIGRGVLEALGLGIDLGPNDLAIRGNFATVKYENDVPYVSDRRAGRIPTEENKRIIEKLSGQIKEIEGVKTGFYPGLEHRFVLKLSFPWEIGEGGDEINDTDPQDIEKQPLKPIGSNKVAKEIAKVLDNCINEVANVIRDEKRANYVLLRGISTYPHLPSYEEAYGLKAGCIATYPMYRGVAKLVGMDVIEVEDNSISSEIDSLKKEYKDFDFIYLHVKKTDSCGEDGNFEGKVSVIEEFDGYIPEIMSLNPDVFVVTGDHSTPSTMKAHSWHPVPIMIKSEYHRNCGLNGFYESECYKGDLGIIKSTEIMPLIMAHSGRLAKYGA
ncbi:MAG: 2,3-bisphosphoglycerate-independent phosphoglycerate mutase [Candidatus Dadabacteria bacterium]|nr:2,3-bisphosphoglycerate-independent phosphoglycerate mutase [Candidatus Dadabacteria bacterium]NIQ13349.1 2,3-bisphosphoglycerate-independent phosphoglycerate mutase [Candidatus Dadabacteria bacterium]